MKVECPHCRTEQELEPYKQWVMKGRDFSNPTKHNTIIVKLFKCQNPDCNKSFRKGVQKKE